MSSQFLQSIEIKMFNMSHLCRSKMRYLSKNHDRKDRRTAEYFCSERELPWQLFYLRTNYCSPDKQPTHSSFVKSLNQTAF